MTDLRSDHEAELYDWHLEQRILFEAGALEPFKVDRLNELAPGWDLAVADNEFDYALDVDHPGLNAALETWWNAGHMPGSSMTLAEIRSHAAALYS